MSNYDIKDKSLAEGGRRRIDWAEREMPVLRRSASDSKRKSRSRACDFRPACMSPPKLPTWRARCWRRRGPGADRIQPAFDPG